MKIVINKCYGGFGLSYAGIMEYAKRKGIKLFAYEIDYPLKTIREYDGTGSEPMFLHYTTKRIGGYQELNEYSWSTLNFERNDPDLIAVVEQLGEESYGSCAKLSIVEIPEGIDYEIQEYDGVEWVAEKHRTWS